LEVNVQSQMVGNTTTAVNPLQIECPNLL